MSLFFNLFRVFDPLAGANSSPIAMPVASPKMPANRTFELDFAI
jgi:hypothetical protein